MSHCVVYRMIFLHRVKKQNLDRRPELWKNYCTKKKITVLFLELDRLIILFLVLKSKFRSCFHFTFVLFLFFIISIIITNTNLLVMVIMLLKLFQIVFLLWSEVNITFIFRDQMYPVTAWRHLFHSAQNLTVLTAFIFWFACKT